MDREKPPYVPPMSGEEAFAMFGDRRLLVLEDQHKIMSERLKTLSQQLIDLNNDPDAESGDVELIRADLQTTREMMREHDRVIRKAAQEFGNKRGPITLH